MHQIDTVESTIMEGASRKRVKTEEEFVTDEMFDELNQQWDYLDKICTDDLKIGKPYKVLSFKMINTQYGRSLTCNGRWT